MIPYKLALLLHKVKASGFGPVRKEGDEYRCRCPAHSDNGPSLYVRLTEDKILIRCNASCTTDEVCDRLDHAVADLFLGEDEPWVDADDVDGVTGAPDAADGAHDGVAGAQGAASQPGSSTLT